MENLKLVILKQYAQVENYEVEFFNIPMDEMAFRKQKSILTNETEMYVAIKNLPYELSHKIENALIKAMSTQENYERLLKILD